MAYRLERGESVIGGLKRVVGEEIKSAGAQLSGAKNADRDEAIHEARKSIKKGPGDAAAGEHGTWAVPIGARMRACAISPGRLSEFRDAFAIIETFDD